MRYEEDSLVIFGPSENPTEYYIPSRTLRQNGIYANGQPFLYTEFEDGSFRLESLQDPKTAERISLLTEEDKQELEEIFSHFRTKSL